MVSCGQCQKRPLPMAQVVVATDYSRAAPLIHGLKFRHQHHWAEVCAELLWQRILTDGIEIPGPLVPMPLHWRRKLWRGYNQAELIARALSRRLAQPVVTLLRRKRATKKQHELPKSQRRRNVSGAFCCRQTPPSTVILIDDVVTSGETAAAATKALHNAGCQKVFLWCVAKTSRLQ